MPERGPIWGRYLPVRYVFPRGWVTGPYWRTKGARAWVIFMIAAPLAVITPVFLLAAIQALFAR
jgi:hypothetical protein